MAKDQEKETSKDFEKFIGKYLPAMKKQADDLEDEYWKYVKKLGGDAQRYLAIWFKKEGDLEGEITRKVTELKKIFDTMKKILESPA